MYGFKIYTGKDANEINAFGVGDDVKLSFFYQVEVLLIKGHKIYFGNLILNTLLVELFKKIY